MIEKTLAKRYAAALLRVTDAEGTTEETESLLLGLKQAYRGQKEFRAVLSQPRIPRGAKKALLRKAFEGRAPRSFLEFLDLLTDKNRLNIIPDIADMFDRLADASKGIVRVKVKSWRPLTDAQKKTLTDQLLKWVGKKIEIDAQTDASLKGGLLIHIGDTVIDGSVARRLKTLSDMIK